MSSPVDFNTSFPAWMKVGWRGIFVKKDMEGISKFRFGRNVLYPLLKAP